MATGLIELIEPGMYTTVQDYPGRVGFWNVGIPPSGPMDSFAHRTANWLVGNPSDAATFELTLNGPTIKFHLDSVVALCGARMAASLDGEEFRHATATLIKRGKTLSIGPVAGPGSRAYLAFQHGILVDPYLGSRATFPKGAFGGFRGRILEAGDYIEIAGAVPDEGRVKFARKRHLPELSAEWTIGAIPGPYAAPDYFLPKDIEEIYTSEFEVHYNSNRLGYRLLGPKPRFARSDGGEGGKHPSNLHDYVYGIGTVNFTGDMPIVIAMDGPSLGGFTSAVTIPSAEFWKIGQASAGDKIRFRRMDVTAAVRLRRRFTRLFADDGTRGRKG